MAGKAATMTPAQIRGAGYIIERYVPTGAGEIIRNRPWVLRRYGIQEAMQRFATRDEAIADLQAELAASKR